MNVVADRSVSARGARISGLRERGRSQRQFRRTGAWEIGWSICDRKRSALDVKHVRDARRRNALGHGKGNAPNVTRSILMRAI
jgi:hypothetical protein